MPTYLHECNSETCKHEWEAFYSIKADPPTICPKCQQETAIRLISGGSGRGIVELSGNELVEKVKANSKALQKEAYKNEATYANIIGETNYSNIQNKIDKQNR